MAFSKADQFAETDQEAAKWGKILSHPARIAILKTLSQMNACVCGTLAQSLPLAQSTVSQHLKTLRESRLIKGEIEGPHQCYCIDRNTLDALQSSLRQLLAELDTFALSCACAPTEIHHKKATP